MAPRGYVFVRDTRSLEIDTATNAATNTCSLAEPRLLERPIIAHAHTTKLFAHALNTPLSQILETPLAVTQ